MKLLEQVQQLQAQLEQRDAKIAELEEKIARLEKNSSNSSKPPSSDIINPKPPAKRGRKRKRGGQKGHKKHSREPFAPEQIDSIIVHEIDKDQVARRGLIELDETVSALQQVELPDKLFNVIEHQVKLYQTPTGRVIKATIPADIRRQGLFTANTTAFVGYCKARCHMSYSTIAEFFKDIVGLEISESFLVKCCNKKLSEALLPAYSEALQYVKSAAIVGTDETGHKDSGKKHWTWCNHADGVAFYRITRHRNTSVLFENLGHDFNAILISDYYGANRKFVRLTDSKVQWCWSHLIRDIRFVGDLGRKNLQKWAEKLIDLIDKLLKAWRKNRERQTKYFERKIKLLKKLFLQRVMRPPDHHEARKIKKRFTRNDSHGYFLFLEHPDVEPTNNATEQKIRFVVLDRRVTQGTNSNAGMRFYERVWTVIATCHARKKSVFNFFKQSLHAHYTANQAPSLL